MITANNKRMNKGRQTRRVEGAPKTVGQHLLKIRGDLGLTQSWVADKAGICQSIVAQVEHGQSCSLRSFLYICKAMEVTPRQMQKILESNI